MCCIYSFEVVFLPAFIKKKLRPKTMNRAKNGEHPKIRFDNVIGKFTKVTEKPMDSWGVTTKTTKKWDSNGIRSSATKKTNRSRFRFFDKSMDISKTINNSYDTKGNLSRKKVAKDKKIF